MGNKSRNYCKGKTTYESSVKKESEKGRVEEVKASNGRMNTVWRGRGRDCHLSLN